VPGVRLHDPNASDRLTIVDLLSHRSGLPRHDLTWVGQPGRSRAELSWISWTAGADGQ
jgi:CubicO group peptidase (beta-lactamase class C family)